MDEELSQSVLHIAATRPALLWGVPYVVAVVIVQIAGIVGVLHWAGPIIGAPLWVLAAVLVRRDYNAPRIWMLWWNSSARCMDAEIWGGSSISPFPINLPKRLRGVADAGR